MNRFDYFRPTSIAEAIAAASEPGSAYLAAGTNLVDLMKIGAARPGKLIDLGRLPGLDRIEWLADGSVRVGAMVRNSDLANTERFARTFPAVAEALLSGASAQLRNAATVGGNLMQQTRCTYFQDLASACNRRAAGSGCDALQGENRAHAILGWTDHCIAVHPSDFCVPLVALDAVVEVQGPSGKRDIPVDVLHYLPGEAALGAETALEPGELITGLRLPAKAADFAGHARYLKLRERTSYAFAVVSVAAAIELADGTISGARIALGGVAAKPWRAREAEAILVGQRPDAEAFARAATIALAEARPSGEANAFKIELARRIVVRALTLASEGTPLVMPALPGSPFAAHSGASHVA